MKLSANNLNETIKLYLNDVEDYDSQEQHMIAENALKPVSKLILESKNDPMTILLEVAKTANKRDKAVLNDFILYVSNI